VQIPKEIKKALRIVIAEEDTDFSAYIEKVLREKLDIHEKKKKYLCSIFYS